MSFSPYYTLESFTAELVQRLGNPASCELPASLTANAINRAIREYSRCHPYNRQEILIYLSPYQEHYNLPTNPDFVFDVTPAAPTTASARAFGNEFRALDIDLVDYHINDLYFNQYKISQYREMFEQVEWNYDSPPTLFITPSPIQQLQCMVIIGSYHASDLTTLDPSMIETFFIGAMGFTQEAWANMRDSLSVMSVPSALGSASLVNGDILRKQAERNIKLFREQIGWNRPTAQHG